MIRPSLTEALSESGEAPYEMPSRRSVCLFEGCSKGYFPVDGPAHVMPTVCLLSPGIPAFCTQTAAWMGMGLHFGATGRRCHEETRRYFTDFASYCQEKFHPFGYRLHTKLELLNLGMRIIDMMKRMAAERELQMSYEMRNP